MIGIAVSAVIDIYVPLNVVPPASAKHGTRATGAGTGIDIERRLLLSCDLRATAAFLDPARLALQSTHLPYKPLSVCGFAGVPWSIPDFGMCLRKAFLASGRGRDDHR